MSDKPKARDMLVLPPEKFWVEVSSVITPGPYKHIWLKCRDVLEDQPGHIVITGRSLGWKCHLCKELLDCKYSELPSDGCIVPPPLTQSNEELVRQWQKKVDRAAVRWAVYRVTKQITMQYGDMESWWYDADPEPRMACLLVAADLWSAE